MFQSADRRRERVQVIGGRAPSGERRDAMLDLQRNKLLAGTEEPYLLTARMNCRAVEQEITQ